MINSEKLEKLEKLEKFAPAGASVPPVNVKSKIVTLEGRIKP